MKLTPEQEVLVRQWAADGASLSDIQSRLASELDIHISYLDTRFLVMDLGATIADKNAKKSEPKVEEVSAPAPQDADEDRSGYGENSSEAQSTMDEVPAEDLPQGGAVKVELSRIQRPGFMASGTIVCSDGKSGEWGITQDGRIALDFGEDKTYRPSAEDVRQFQQQLRELLMRGY